MVNLKYQVSWRSYYTIITHLGLDAHYLEVSILKRNTSLSLSLFYGPNDRNSRVVGFSFTARDWSLVSLMQLVTRSVTSIIRKMMENLE